MQTQVCMDSKNVSESKSHLSGDKKELLEPGGWCSPNPGMGNGEQVMLPLEEALSCSLLLPRPAYAPPTHPLQCGVTWVLRLVSKHSSTTATQQGVL